MLQKRRDETRTVWTPRLSQMKRVMPTLTLRFKSYFKSQGQNRRKKISLVAKKKLVVQRLQAIFHETAKVKLLQRGKGNRKGNEGSMKGEVRMSFSRWEANSRSLNNKSSTM